MASNRTPKTSITADVLAVIAEIQPCTSEEVWRRGFPTCDRQQIMRTINKLSSLKKISRSTTPDGSVGVYVTNLKPVGVYVLPADAPPPSFKPKPRPSEITQARTYHTVETYRATNWRLSMPLRPGALDHEKHPSLRAGVRVPYAPAVLTIQGGRR